MKRNATVTRTSHREKTIPVEIPDKELAGKTPEEVNAMFDDKAYQTACDTDFSEAVEDDSDYEVTSWNSPV